MAPDIGGGPIELSQIYEEPSNFLAKSKIEPQDEKTESNKVNRKGWFNFQSELKWTPIIFLFIVHVYGILGYYYIFYKLQHWKTFIFMYVYVALSSFGVTGGVHRFWTHRAYKAKTPLKIILCICFIASGQNSIYNWVRDHRVHHKYSDTDADPHNINRGLFFSHVGWLFLKKHPDVITKGRQIDMSDIVNDPVAAFFERHYMLFKIIFAYVLPVAIPMIFWNETLFFAVSIRFTGYITSLNGTWSVNSFGHYLGNKPYHKDIAPAENAYVSFFSLGEGWHNYHHVFPYDYRAAEIGGGRTSMTTRLIDMFAKIGWAYDLRVPSESLVNSIIEKRGDATYKSLKTLMINTMISCTFLISALWYFTHI